MFCWPVDDSRSSRCELLLSQPRRPSGLGRRYGYNPCPPKLEGIRRPVSGTLLLQGRRQALAPPPSAEVSGTLG